MQQRANDILRGGLRDVRRRPLAQARAADTTSTYDFLAAYDTFARAADTGALKVVLTRT